MCYIRGLLMELIAIPLLLTSWAAALVSVLVVIPAILFRINVEEFALRERFGEEYVSYQRGTFRLIPFLF